MVIVLIGVLVAIAGPRIMRRRGAGANWVQGNLLVTGVSPKPDATGEQLVTITGVINGPTVNSTSCISSSPSTSGTGRPWARCSR